MGSTHTPFHDRTVAAFHAAGGAGTCTWSGLSVGALPCGADLLGEANQSRGQAPRSSTALVEQFQSENVFWRQFVIGQEIVERRNPRVLPILAAWLNHEDRHVRGNVAFIFAGFGDPRGFNVIVDILTDRSDRPRGVIAGGNWMLRAQFAQTATMPRIYWETFAIRELSRFLSRC